jgi:hypothetical protein
VSRRARARKPGAPGNAAVRRDAPRLRRPGLWQAGNRAVSQALGERILFGPDAQPSAREFEIIVISTLALAQFNGRNTAEIHLDAGLPGRRDEVLEQVRALVEATLHRTPKVTAVEVYFGGALGKTITAGAKK